MSFRIVNQQYVRVAHCSLLSALRGALERGCKNRLPSFARESGPCLDPHIVTLHQKCLDLPTPPVHMSISFWCWDA